MLAESRPCRADCGKRRTRAVDRGGRGPFSAHAWMAISRWWKEARPVPTSGCAVAGCRRRTGLDGGVRSGIPGLFQAAANGGVGDAGRRAIVLGHCGVDAAGSGRRPGRTGVPRTRRCRCSGRSGSACGREDDPDRPALANGKRWPPAPKRDSGAQSPAAHAAASSAHGINRLKVACGQGMAACRRATVAHPPSPTERTHGTGATAIGYRLAWWVPGAIAGNDRCGFSCPGTPRGFLHARPPPVRSTVIRLRGAPAVRRPTGRTPRRPAASAAHRHCRCCGPVRSRRGSGRRHGFAADRADGRRGRCRAAE